MSKHVVAITGQSVSHSTVGSTATDVSERIEDLERQVRELREALLTYIPDLRSPGDASYPAPTEHMTPRPVESVGHWKVKCLGDFELCCGNFVLAPCPSKRGWSILKYLLASTNYAATSEALIECFWPDAEPSAGLHSLRVAVHALRRSLQGCGPDGTDETVLFSSDRYILNPALVIIQDVDRFRQAYQQGTRPGATGNAMETQRVLEEARSYYTGDYLAESPYEDWTVARRTALKDMHLSILSHLCSSYIEQAEWECAADCCIEILTADPYREDAYRQLMQCYSALGRLADVHRVYEACHRTLDRDLHLWPARETTYLYQRLISTS